MFVEASGVESDVEFQFSRLFEVIDHYENTIRIHVQLPVGSNGNIFLIVDLLGSVSNYFEYSIFFHCYTLVYLHGSVCMHFIWDCVANVK